MPVYKSMGPCLFSCYYRGNVFLALEIKCAQERLAIRYTGRADPVSHVTDDVILRHVVRLAIGKR